jgi:Ca2+-binding RTX toxin-like protein
MTTFNIQEIVTNTLGILGDFISDSGFSTKISLAFGAEKAALISPNGLLSALNTLPEVVILTSEQLNEGLGAFSASTGKIYLSEAILTDEALVIRTLLEEIGHYLDDYFGRDDAAGDEGAIFASLVLGDVLDAAQLTQLQQEDDHAEIFVDGAVIAVEMANITGTPGNDNLVGTDSNDRIEGRSGNDTISGNGGNDDLFGEDGDDVLNGGNDGDDLFGGIGNDVLNGDAGNDFLYSDAGNDTINGGSGTDNYRADYSNASSGLTMTYDSATGSGTIVVGSETDTFTSIEEFDFFEGTNFDDVIFGGSGNDANIEGGSGNDTISGNAGNDDLFGQDGDDVLNGGNDGDDLFGGIGNDVLNGDAGNDFLYSDAGNDTINGGSGTDNYRADYSNASSGLTMTYDSATGSGTIVVGSETDTFTSIEEFDFFEGTNFDDVIFGGSGNDANIEGGSGNDTISGNAGNDDLFGEDGDDVLNGGNDGDDLFGGIGNDVLNGDAGNDFLYSDAGNDTINGGSGTDNYRADYSNASSGLTMTYDSATGSGTIVVGSETDTFTSIEEFDFFEGTNFDDVIFGGSGNDANIEGGSGNDTISGNAGNDDLFGQDGDDVLNGGNDGDDLFGGIGNDVLNGDAGNDNLRGDQGNDTLQGTNSGTGERDTLEGGLGSDLFILGDADFLGYDDGNGSSAGTNDYAQIADFNSSEDTIQLRGSSSDYILVVSGSDTDIFLDKPGTEPDELIATIENQTGLSLTESYFSYVLSANGSPTDLTLDNNIVDENQPINTTVGTFSTTDPDTGDTFTYSLVTGTGDTDNSLFTIDGNTLKTNAIFDFESQNSYSIRVETTDSANNTYSESLTININDLNDVPTDLTLDNNIVDENQPINTTVGTFSTTDPDTGDTFTYSLVTGNGDTDNSLFTIDGNTLKTNAIFDFESQNSYSIRVETTDSANNTYSESLTININDLNENNPPPTTTQPATVEIVLYQDNNGVLGDVINSNEAILGDNFFVEVKLGDIRTDAVGLVAAALDLGFAADVAQNIDNFADLTSIITSNFPLFQTGTLDNTTGNIDNLGAGSLPPSFGSVIGVNQSDRFALLNFTTTDDRDDSQIILDLDASQTGFADGLFADPSATLQFTRTLIINDAPELDAIANTTLSENAAVGTVVVADSLVIANDDEFGDTPTFTLTTSPTDGNGDELFAIDANTGEITLTQAGADTIDFESGNTSYNLGITASDGFKTSTEETFTVNLINENEAIIKVFVPNGQEADGIDDITFTTELSRFRTDSNGDPVTDSEFVRPNYADTFKFIDILNDTSGNEDILQITNLDILQTLTGVSINAPAGDILISPGETRRFFLTYAPGAAGEDFSDNNGLTILSNATNDSSFEVSLAGKSTYNSDISYDGTVNLSDLVTLQRPGLFGSSSGQNNYDPTSDITGDGNINLAELVPLNAEFGSSVI